MNLIPAKNEAGWGIASATGEWILPPTFDDISASSSETFLGLKERKLWQLRPLAHPPKALREIKNSIRLLRLSEGFCAFEFKERIGFFDSDSGLAKFESRFLLPRCFHGSICYQFHDGLVGVILDAPEPELAVLSADGSEVVPADAANYAFAAGRLVLDSSQMTEPGDPPFGWQVFNVKRTSNDSFVPFGFADEIYAPIFGFFAYRRGQKWGISTEGLAPLTLPAYESVEILSKRLAAVGLGQHSKLFDLSGNSTLEPVFDEFSNLGCGLVGGRKNASWYILDETGREMGKAKYVALK